MAESTEARTHGLIENAKNAHARGATKFQARKPSDRVIERLQGKGLIVDDIEGRPDRVSISFEPTIELFKVVQDTP